jgi:hypothetical protein
LLTMLTSAANAQSKPEGVNYTAVLSARLDSLSKMLERQAHVLDTNTIQLETRKNKGPFILRGDRSALVKNLTRMSIVLSMHRLKEIGGFRYLEANLSNHKSWEL